MTNAKTSHEIRKPDAVLHNEYGYMDACRAALCGAVTYIAMCGAFVFRSAAPAMMDFLIWQRLIHALFLQKGFLQDEVVREAQVAFSRKHKALREAAKTNDLDAARNILAEGYSPSGYEGISAAPPLWLAVEYQHEDMVDLLLEHGADPHPKRFRETLVGEARQHGNLRIYKALLLAGAEDEGALFAVKNPNAGLFDPAYDIYHVIRQDGNVELVLERYVTYHFQEPVQEVKKPTFYGRPAVQRLIAWDGKKNRYPLQKLPTLTMNCKNT